MSSNDRLALDGHGRIVSFSPDTDHKAALLATTLFEHALSAYATTASEDEEVLKQLTEKIKGIGTVQEHLSAERIRMAVLVRKGEKLILEEALEAVQQFAKNLKRYKSDDQPISDSLRNAQLHEVL